MEVAPSEDFRIARSVSRLAAFAAANMYFKSRFSWPDSFRSLHSLAYIRLSPENRTRLQAKHAGERQPRRELRREFVCNCAVNCSISTAVAIAFPAGDTRTGMANLSRPRNASRAPSLLTFLFSISTFFIFCGKFLFFFFFFLPLSRFFPHTRRN